MLGTSTFKHDWNKHTSILKKRGGVAFGIFLSSTFIFFYLVTVVLIPTYTRYALCFAPYVSLTFTHSRYALPLASI